jgi:hypothetical protein
MADNGYTVVPLDIKAALAKAQECPGFTEAWDALEEKYSTLDALLTARKLAGLSQPVRRRKTQDGHVATRRGCLGELPRGPRSRQGSGPPPSAPQPFHRLRDETWSADRRGVWVSGWCA